MNINSRIRRAILRWIAVHGQTDTRQLIRNMAISFGTTKQRISGNISYLVRNYAVNINRNFPHSTIY